MRNASNRGKTQLRNASCMCQHRCPENIKAIHGYIIRSRFESHVFVGSAVVDMYCKCGSVMDAHQMFDKMSERDVVSCKRCYARQRENIVCAFSYF